MSVQWRWPTCTSYSSWQMVAFLLCTRAVRVTLGTVIDYITETQPNKDAQHVHGCIAACIATSQFIPRPYCDATYCDATTSACSIAVQAVPDFVFGLEGKAACLWLNLSPMHIADCNIQACQMTPSW
jgi:hypothetical protein